MEATSRQRLTREARSSSGYPSLKGNSLTAKDAEDAKEDNSFTAKDANAARENHSFTAKDAKGNNSLTLANSSCCSVCAIHHGPAARKYLSNMLIERCIDAGQASALP